MTQIEHYIKQKKSESDILKELKDFKDARACSHSQYTELVMQVKALNEAYFASKSTTFLEESASKVLRKLVEESIKDPAVWASV